MLSRRALHKVIAQRDVVGFHVRELLGDVGAQELHVLIQDIVIGLDVLVGKGIVRGAGLLGGRTGPGGGGQTGDVIGAAVEQSGELLVELDRKSTRLNSSHIVRSRMPSSA